MIRYQNILSVQAPNQGVSTGIGEFVQETAYPFTLGGSAYQFGQPGLVERMTTFGEAARLRASDPEVVCGVGRECCRLGRQVKLPYVSKEDSN